MYKILAINPGSTSTKVAVYEDDQQQAASPLEHSRQELARFSSIMEQLPYRNRIILDWLKMIGYAPDCFSAVVGRGGLLYPVRAGAYAVNEKMINRLREPLTQHESNLGALMAKEIAGYGAGIAMIYDGVTVDEMIDEARLTGLPQKERPSLCHALSMRAVSHVAAEQMGGNYKDYNFVVVHLGGGITSSVHEKGRMKDIISDDEGSFSPERGGKIPTRWLIEAIFENNLDKNASFQMLRGKTAGINAYLGTSDIRILEKLSNEGDKKASLILSSMAYNVAKDIGALATTLNGAVDRVIITGGIAYSSKFVADITERVKFIAPICVIPGEKELEALALGAYRVLKGQETLHEYSDEPRKKLFPEYE